MGFRILRRTKTLFLMFGLISLALYMLLNSLAAEFSADDGKLSGTLLKYPKNLQLRSEKLKLSNEFQANFVAQGQRKPKTMNLQGNEDHTDDSIVYEKDKRNLNGNNNEINEEDMNKVENMQIKDNIQNINGNYEQDDDDNNTDDDYEDEDDEKDVDTDDDAYQYDDVTNPVFKPGDFGDIRGLEFYRKPKLKYADVIDENKQRGNGAKPDQEDEQGDEKPKNELIENGMFWSDYVESLIPRGLSYANVTKLLQHLRKQVVQTLEKPTWDKCGRPLNGYAVLGDGTRMCARYRHQHYSFVYGEALSFYLSRLLRMDNVPTVVLTRTNTTSKQWRGVNISSLTWEEDKTVALIQWIDDLDLWALSKAYTPPIILDAYRKGRPVTSHVIRTSSLLDRSPAHISEVVQWGTMIVFDFLTGNYDRIASMQDAEDREHNPKIMEEPIRNLRKSSKNGKLWLIDNESGLFDAYELLQPHLRNSRFTTFHNKMLQTMCVFQSSLVNALRKLSEQPAPHKRLLNFAGSFEPLISNLPKDNHYELFAETFDKRLAQVMEWIRHCQIIDVG